jgi:hypothetical protein
LDILEAKWGANHPDVARALGNPVVRAAAFLYAGAAEGAAGNPTLAQEYFRCSLADAIASGNRSAESLTIGWMAARTPPERRDAAYLEAVTHLTVTKDWLAMWSCLESLASHWAVVDPPAAGQLLGYLDAHHIGHGGLARRRRRATDLVNQAGAASSFALGAQLTRAELLDLVLGRLTGAAGQSANATR